MSMPLSSARALSPSRRPVAGLRGWLSRLVALFAVQRSRRQLRDLDEAILRDIGLSRDEALREAERGFWDWEQVRRG